MTSAETWRGADEMWFVEYEGRVVGPVTGQQLMGAIQAGKVGPTARVRRPSSEEWVGIATNPAFAAALGIAPAAAADPFAGFPATVSLPPAAAAPAAPQPGPPLTAAPAPPGKRRIPPAALAALGCGGLVGA
jgi:hypothetical protein